MEYRRRKTFKRSASNSSNINNKFTKKPRINSNRKKQYSIYNFPFDFSFKNVFSYLSSKVSYPVPVPKPVPRPRSKPVPSSSSKPRPSSSSKPRPSSSSKPRPRPRSKPVPRPRPRSKPVPRPRSKPVPRPWPKESDNTVSVRVGVSSKDTDVARVVRATKKKHTNKLVFKANTLSKGLPVPKDGFYQGMTKWEMVYSVNFNKPKQCRSQKICIIQNITLTLNIKTNPNNFTITDAKKNLKGQWDPLVFTKNTKNIKENDVANGEYKAYYTELFNYNETPNKTDKSGFKDMFPVSPWIFSTSREKKNHAGELDYSVHGEIFQIPATRNDLYQLGIFKPAGHLKARLGHTDTSSALGEIRTRCVKYNIIDNHIKKINLMGSDNNWVSFKDTDTIDTENIPTIEPLDLVY